MKHYHGTPLGGTRQSVARFARSGNRHFLIPFLRPEDLPVVAEVCCGFCLDNSAFTAWKQGTEIKWAEFYKWVREWGCHPRCDFVLIPDVIDGSEADNNLLLGKWCQNVPFSLHITGVPVFHLHESMNRLEYLMDHFGRIALGSSGKYTTPGTESWSQRMDEVMRTLCDDGGRPKVKIHGLRMMAKHLVSDYPFASADSTNVAQNAGRVCTFGRWQLPNADQRREVVAMDIESVRSPATYHFQAKQLTIEQYKDFVS